MIDARAGADYRADASYPYQAGTTYHIRIDVDLPAHTYSVRVSDGTIAGNIRLDTGNARGTIQPTLTLANGDKCTSGNLPITYSASF